MNLHLIDVPESSVELSAWLERRLVGQPLRELASELAALWESGKRRDAGKRVSHALAPELADFSGLRHPRGGLNDVLGERLPDVLHRGLAALPERQLHELLRYPSLLIELQERVLAEGGEHWDRLLAASPGLPEAVQRMWPQIDAGLAAPPATPPAPPVPPPPPSWPPSAETTEPMTPRASIQWRLLGVMAAATALSLLAGFFLHDTIKPPAAFGPRLASSQPASWGWSAPDALPQNLPAGRYLAGLANAAEAWFNKRPEEAAAVAQRILEFRQGCSTLLLAEHKPLDEQQRQWLRDACGRWAAKLHDHLVELESGAPPLEVRQAADETVRQLTAKLRQKAEEAAAS